MSKTSTIEEVLENFVHVSEGTYLNGESYRYEDQGWYQWSEVADGGDPVKVPDLGVVSIVDYATGGEGSAEHIYMVFEITDAEGGVKFYQKTGYYASFDGSNWDGDFSEVAPSEKTITVYTPVK